MKFPKRPPFRSDVYLDYVRSHPCQVPGCTQPAPSEAHHWKPFDGGLGLKCGDQWTMSCCRSHHAQYHTTGRFDGLTREETRDIMVAAQWRLLGEWVGNEGF